MNASSTPFDMEQQLQRLRDPDKLSPDAALEVASQVTGTGHGMAVQLEEEGRLYEAAQLYDTIAEAWRQMVVKLPGDRQHHFESLVEYWAQRAEATRRRAAETHPTTPPSSGPPPSAPTTGPISDTSIQSNKPITRPLNFPGVQRGKTGQIIKGSRAPAPAKSEETKISRR
jgi:hypothetical protein